MAKTRKPQDPKPKEPLKVGGETFPGGVGELRLRCKDLCLVAPQGLSKKDYCVARLEYFHQIIEYYEKARAHLRNTTTPKTDGGALCTPPGLVGVAPAPPVIAAASAGAPPPPPPPPVRTTVVEVPDGSPPETEVTTIPDAPAAVAHTSAVTYAEALTQLSTRAAATAQRADALATAFDVDDEDVDSDEAQTIATHGQESRGNLPATLKVDEGEDATHSACLVYKHLREHAPQQLLFLTDKWVKSKDERDQFIMCLALLWGDITTYGGKFIATVGFLVSCPSPRARRRWRRSRTPPSSPPLPPTTTPSPPPSGRADASQGGGERVP
jgi:hypothetical protein